MSTYITRTAQVRQYYLSANLRNDNPQFRQMLNGISTTLQMHGLSAGEALRQAYARVFLMVQQQATSLAYKDAVSALAVLVACLIPLTFIMKKPPAHGAAPPMH